MALGAIEPLTHGGTYNGSVPLRNSRQPGIGGGYVPPEGGLTGDMIVAQANALAAAARGGIHGKIDRISPETEAHLRAMVENQAVGPVLQAAYAKYGTVFGQKDGQLSSPGNIRKDVVSTGDGEREVSGLVENGYVLHTPRGEMFVSPVTSKDVTTGYDTNDERTTPGSFTGTFNIADAQAAQKGERKDNRNNAIQAASYLALVLGPAITGASAAAPATGGASGATQGFDYAAQVGQYSGTAQVGLNSVGQVMGPSVGALASTPTSSVPTGTPPGGGEAPLTEVSKTTAKPWYQSPMAINAGTQLAGAAISAATPKKDPPQPSRKTGYTIRDMTPLDQEVAKISGEQWDRYVQKFQPFENKVMWDVANTERFIPQELGAINADLAQKQTSLGTYTATAGKRTGAMLNPATEGSGGYAATLARGNVAGLNANAAEKASAMGNVVEMGRGGANTAVTGLGTAAKMSSQSAIDDLQARTNASNFNANASTQDGINQNAYLTSLFSSGAGVTMYGADKGWFK